eukprot:g2504.t1
MSVKSRFEEWCEDTETPSAFGKSFGGDPGATHSGSFKRTKAAPKALMTLHRIDDGSRQSLWKDEGAHASKKAATAAAKAKAERVVEAEKRLHARLLKEGLVVPKDRFQEPRQPKWTGKHGENVSLGMSQKMQLRDKSAKLRKQRADAAAQREKLQAATKAAKEAQEDRLADAIMIHQAEQHVAPKQRPKLMPRIFGLKSFGKAGKGGGKAKARATAKVLAQPEATGAQGSGGAAAGPAGVVASAERRASLSRRFMRRLSMATVVQIVTMGVRARRKAKQRQRQRLRYKREREARVTALRVGMGEQRRAADLRKEVTERHEAARQQLEAEGRRNLQQAMDEANKPLPTPAIRDKRLIMH